MTVYNSDFEVCVFPRKDDEVCRLVPALKILEAMAMAKPVVVSDVAPLVEMVDSGTTGLSFKVDNPASLADALATLAEDPTTRAQLASQGRDWVIANRSWQQVARRYLPIYGMENDPQGH